MVFATAVRLLGNATDAEDVAQAVFLKAWDRFAEIGPSPTAGGWLKTVTTNLCLNHLTRYRARWKFFSELRREEDDDEGGFEHRLAAADETGADAEQADQRELLEQALRRLPDAQRVPLVLYHFENKSYEDIAAQLGVSLGKVKTDIHRGRDALKKKLKLDTSGEAAGLKL
jgi:RNA polymerase sigma-70 factor (ECF subfamily)